MIFDDKFQFVNEVLTDEMSISDARRVWSKIEKQITVPHSKIKKSVRWRTTNNLVAAISAVILVVVSITVAHNRHAATGNGATNEAARATTNAKATFLQPSYFPPGISSTPKVDRHNGGIDISYVNPNKTSPQKQEGFVVRERQGVQLPPDLGAHTEQATIHGVKAVWGNANTNVIQLWFVNHGMLFQVMGQNVSKIQIDKIGASLIANPVPMKNIVAPAMSDSLPNGKVIYYGNAPGQWDHGWVRLLKFNRIPNGQTYDVSQIGSHPTVLSSSRVTTPNGPAQLVLYKFPGGSGKASNKPTYAYVASIYRPDSVAVGMQTAYCLEIEIKGDPKTVYGSVLEMIMGWRVNT